jgi:Uma2 family endonuclease
MASGERAADLVTVEDFYALVEDGQKADLIDGVIYMASPDSYVDDQLAGFLSSLMRGFAEAHDLGKVFGSRFAFRLSPLRAPEPDVAFVKQDRLGLVDARGMNGGPDVAVEVVSHDSRSRDYGEKKRLYEDAGVAEYWIVDPGQRRAEFYRLEQALYRLTPLDHNRVFRSQALHGFWLDVEWLFVGELPKTSEKLAEILVRTRKTPR